MSVLIKGLEMPNNCWDCIARRGIDIGVGIADGCEILKAMIYDPNERLDDCPLIPVPPHGRLIDLDAFMKGCQDLGRTEVNNGYSTPEDIEIKMEFIRMFFEKINPTPTVIPAEEAT